MSGVRCERVVEGDRDAADGVAATDDLVENTDVCEDVTVARGVEADGDLEIDADPAHAAEMRETALRAGTSWLGRVDISVTWRRAWAATTELHHRDELWLVGTWRL